MKAKCHYCGQATKRNCPALEKAICPCCCATRRLTEIACVPECERNTFGFLAVETFRKLDFGLPSVILPVLRELSLIEDRDVAGAMETAERDESAAALLLYRLFFLTLYHRRTTNGKTAFEIWKERGFPGLTHDQRLALEYKSGVMPTVFEFQRGIDANFVEIVDLLEPERGPLRLMDPVFVKQSHPRYSQFLAPIETFPHFVRAGLVLNELPHEISPRFIERVREAAKAPAYVAAPRPVKAFLLDHFDECQEWIAQMSKEFRREQLSRIDCKEIRARYAIVSHRADILTRLRNARGIEEDDAPSPEYPEARCFLLEVDEDKDETVSGSVHISMSRDTGNGKKVNLMGEIFLFPDHLIAKAMSSKKHEYLKREIDAMFGRWVHFESETVRDLTKEIMAQRGENADKPRPSGKSSAPDIPPATQRRMIKDMFDSHYRQFLDDKIPALNGLTPREAAVRSETRPALIALMKDHIHQAAKQHPAIDGATYDLGWVLKELDLRELM